MKQNETYYLVSLGCAKNTVDSASMCALLERAGFLPVEKAARASLLVVNTCGFIQEARQESLQVLKAMARKKKNGQMLIAAGCLTERFREQIVELIPGIDGVMGTRRWMDVVKLTRALRQRQSPAPLYHLPDVASIGTDEGNVLRAAVQGSSAYLKIADGCRRPCAFCAIPLIKGTLVSRPPQRIIAEAKALQEMGVKELILIAQDTTDYGHELGIEDGLAQLLEDMIPEVPDITWIRILYAYPGYVTDRLIELMTAQKQIVPYLDIPLQHAHPEILRKMHRPANIEWVYQTITKMRAALPDLALRTTFIVGYPGEGEKEFQTLLDFMAEMRFDRVGAFTFSFEEGTASEALGDPIPAEVKQGRLERLMALQKEVSQENNRRFIGRNLDVLVEGASDGISVGRSYRDAPEIDGLVILEGEAQIGEIVSAQITAAMEYDLTGYLVHQPG